MPATFWAGRQRVNWRRPRILLFSRSVRAPGPSLVYLLAVYSQLFTEKDSLSALRRAALCFRAKEYCRLASVGLSPILAP